MHKILLLSPYDAMSHRYWREGLRSFLTQTGGYQVTEAVLPPRFFSWRFRGNSLTYAAQEALQRPYDVVIATSMTDLSSLRGLNRQLALIPAILYFHENQFDYPDQRAQGLLERQITSIYSALGAEVLFFNSAYNLKTFMDGVAALLAKMPDGVPPGVVNDLKQRASVVPIALLDHGLPVEAESPLQVESLPEPTAGESLREPTAAEPLRVPTAAEPLRELSAAKPLRVPTAAEPLRVPTAAEPLREPSAAKPLRVPAAAEPLRVLWNHRWEYDKGPDLLLDIVRGLIEQGFPFTLSLLGQRFKQHPPQFDVLLKTLADGGRLGVTEFVDDRAAYLKLLTEHDVVLSTALHEFQGLSVQESMAHGCLPVVPDALCYPEYVPEGLRYVDANDAVRLLMGVHKFAAEAEPDLSLTQYDWCSVGPKWLNAIKKLIAEYPANRGQETLRPR